MSSDVITKLDSVYHVLLTLKEHPDEKIYSQVIENIKEIKEFAFHTENGYMLVYGTDKKDIKSFPLAELNKPENISNLIEIVERKIENFDPSSRNNHLRALIYGIINTRAPPFKLHPDIFINIQKRRQSMHEVTLY